MSPRNVATGYVICLSNDGYPAALEVRKVYRAIPDETAASRGLIRVFDESGEDYLYPETMFVEVSLPPRAAASFAVSNAR